MSLLDPLGAWLRRRKDLPWRLVDEALYVVYAGGLVLFAALTFYRSMLRQTHGEWSAPLDDVFIHFDYARATARGYPFQWSEGNGFSSGNTSLLYPFVLGFGFWIGFTGISLMVWSALIACVSTFGFLLAAAGLTNPIGRWAKYLLPPVVLSVGALNWSLWSGMENAFFLGLWGLALHFTLEAESVGRSPVSSAGDRARATWLAGLASALVFATRPEGATSIVALALYVAAGTRRSHGTPSALAAVLRIGLPAAIVLTVQTLTNAIMTGEWSANGAIAKLTVNNPFMTATEKWHEYLALLQYVVLRNTQHHFAEGVPWGWIVPVVGALPLFARQTRPLALVMWGSILAWLAVISLNGQVRWQNERYTMSAVAWTLTLFAMGVALVLRGAASSRLVWFGGRRSGYLLVGRAGAAIAILSVYWIHQLPQMNDQIWFFGRASRNIREQHFAAGRILKEISARRALVGDAGALMYVSDRPGLDLIGLGGFHDLPFARAGLHGLGASLELIERLAPADRPDVMAIYPSWWGDLPTLFGHRIAEAPVFGNVICGGASKVIYRTDWSSLDRSSKPRVIRPGEIVVDELDVADLVSEKAHRYAYPTPSMGFVEFRILGDVLDRKRDLFDAGRVIPPAQRERARVRLPQGGGRLVVRTATVRRTSVEVSINGASAGRLTLEPARGWTEPWIDLPAGLGTSAELSLAPIDHEWLDCHVWILGSDGGPAEQAGHGPASHAGGDELPVGRDR